MSLASKAATRVVASASLRFACASSAPRLPPAAWSTEATAEVVRGTPAIPTVACHEVRPLYFELLQCIWCADSQYISNMNDRSELEHMRLCVPSLAMATGHALACWLLTSNAHSVTGSYGRVQDLVQEYCVVDKQNVDTICLFGGCLVQPRSKESSVQIAPC